MSVTDGRKVDALGMKDREVTLCILIICLGMTIFLKHT